MGSTIGLMANSGSVTYRASKAALQYCREEAASLEWGREGVACLLTFPSGLGQRRIWVARKPISNRPVSITGMHKVIATITTVSNGHFFDYTGRNSHGKDARIFVALPHCAFCSFQCSKGKEPQNNREQ
jgi:hypothetical protein